MSMNYSYDTTGNRTRDIPVRSAVPQPTAPPCVPTLFALRTKCLERQRQSLFLLVNFKKLAHKFSAKKKILMIL